MRPAFVQQVPPTLVVSSVLFLRQVRRHEAGRHHGFIDGYHSIIHIFCLCDVVANRHIATESIRLCFGRRGGPGDTCQRIFVT